MRHLSPRGPVQWFLAIWRVLHLRIRNGRRVCVYEWVLTSSYLKKAAEGETIQCDPLCLSVQKKKKKIVGVVIGWVERRIMCYFCSLYCSCGIHPGKLHILVHCCWKKYFKITEDTEHVYLSAKLVFAAEQVKASSFYSQWEGTGLFQVWATWHISDIYFRVR